MGNSNRLPRLIYLSEVYDQNYVDRREERIAFASWQKRSDLLRCLAEASGKEVIVLSAPPKALDRRAPRWLPALETRFSTVRQLVCANWDAPKIRTPLVWLLFAIHAMREARDGDIVFLDNYEFVQVFAAWGIRLTRRDVAFVLDYEDGNHLLRKSWMHLLCLVAEFLEKPLLSGALLAHPGLKKRLPESVLTEVVPGFIVPNGARRNLASPIRFLYSGSLDRTRGVGILLNALQHLPEKGWTLDISGMGELTGEIEQLVQEPQWKEKVRYHGALSETDYRQLTSDCQVGLNCQQTGDPLSAVTFPSKVFNYLSAGLLVLSSRASEVPAICGNACLYYDDNTAESLADGMKKIICDPPGAAKRVWLEDATEHYSIAGTAARLAPLLKALQKAQ